MDQCTDSACITNTVISVVINGNKLEASGSYKLSLIYLAYETKSCTFHVLSAGWSWVPCNYHLPPPPLEKILLRLIPFSTNKISSYLEEVEQCASWSPSSALNRTQYWPLLRDKEGNRTGNKAFEHWPTSQHYG